MMAARFLGRWPDRSEQWHAARANRIGGSDIGTVLGWNQYETRAQLLAVKRGEAEPRPMTGAMKRGTHMEAAIRSWLTAEEGIRLLPDLRGTYVHEDFDFALANPDDIDSDGVLWEYKAPSVRDMAHGWGRAGTSAVPLSYQAQAIWNAGIVGATKIRFCVWAGAPKFEPAFYKVPFDPAIFVYLLEQASVFHAAMLAGRKLKVA